MEHWCHVINYVNLADLYKYWFLNGNNVNNNWKKLPSATDPLQLRHGGDCCAEVSPAPVYTT